MGRWVWAPPLSAGGLLVLALVYSQWSTVAPPPAVSPGPAAAQGDGEVHPARDAPTEDPGGAMRARGSAGAPADRESEEDRGQLEAPEEADAEDEETSLEAARKASEDVPGLEGIENLPVVVLDEEPDAADVADSESETGDTSGEP
ncbi:MAG: hypothetical protein L0Y66_22090 [Myxococcaceae bacterium]|nr:hypothetical protein [Myxococcaceae bacterium]MCI0672858.1 hypothetical protein [Myxococcaceae bacterium]